VSFSSMRQRVVAATHALIDPACGRYPLARWGAVVDTPSALLCIFIRRWAQLFTLNCWELPHQARSSGQNRLFRWVALAFGLALRACTSGSTGLAALQEGSPPGPGPLSTPISTYFTPLIGFSSTGYFR
jgi:hypothetical protein